MTPAYWWPFLLVLFLLGVLLQVYLLAAFAAMLAVISGLARWWQGRALLGVTYKRFPYYRRGFPGEKVQLRLEAENHKFLPLSWLFVKDPWPWAVGPEDEELLSPTHIEDRAELINLFSLRWYERTRRVYTLLFRKRGVYTLGPARLESGDLFGIFEQVDASGPVDYLTVFPKPLPLEAMNLPADDPFGDRRSQRRLYEDTTQPMGMRDYHPEDDFRHVHWPATAHTGQLQVKVYQPTSARVMVVCLNVSTFEYYWQGVDPPLLEHMVSATASLVQRALADGYRVGLLSNGCLAHADQPFQVPPGRSPQQLSQLLEALAGVTPFVTATFESVLTKHAPQLPYGARLFILTAITTPKLNATLLRIRQHGRRVNLLSFSPQPPPKIPGIQTVHAPYYG